MCSPLEGYAVLESSKEKGVKGGKKTRGSKREYRKTNYWRLAKLRGRFPHGGGAVSCSCEVLGKGKKKNGDRGLLRHRSFKAGDFRRIARRQGGKGGKRNAKK